MVSSSGNVDTLAMGTSAGPGAEAGSLPGDDAASGTNGADGTTGEPLEPVGPDGFFQLEALDRGVVAVDRGDVGVYVGWRLFGYDPDAIAFNVYRSGTLVTATPIADSTNFVDAGGAIGDLYSVAPVIDGIEGAASKLVSVWGTNFLEIPLQPPSPGTNQDGDFTYTSSDGSVGDLDGDGDYEIVIKWEPSNAKDNSQGGFTGNVLLDAYQTDGSLLWRIDLGVNIRAGAHYTQFLVYDLDGDGRSEVALKTAPGTVDGAGTPVLLGTDEPTADFRNDEGYVLDGPEYFTVFDGLTGTALATAPFAVPRGNVNDWGDGYGNRVDRFLATIAYVDDTGRPSAVMTRGYYTRATLTAWNWRDGVLTEAWTADSDSDTAYTGQGAHSLTVANVDDDIFQEIVFGASTIDHDGTRLCQTALGHGDALHASDFIVERPGIEVFMPHESQNTPGATLRDGATCEVLWQLSSTGNNEGPGRGVLADIDPDSPGAEAWIGNTLWSATGSVGATATAAMTVVGGGPSSTNFVISWDADPAKELLNGTQIRDYVDNALLLDADGCESNNGTKSTPTLSADILGDSREEVIFRCGTSVRMYTTTDVASDRLYTLMHDPQYRVAISWQNVAYNQPPHTSFYMGEGMAVPAKPDMHLGVPLAPELPPTEPAPAPGATP